MNKLKLISAFLILTAAVFYSGCGDDSGIVDPAANAPTINMKVGSFYVFNIDSLATSGTVQGTRLKTSHTFLNQGTYFGQSNVFQIKAETKDSTILPVLASDTFYVRYDGGKFYQYGVIQLIDPAQTPTWDLVADFTVSQGTQWTIASNISIVIGPVTATATIKGKITGEETFVTHGYGSKTINCFRSEITADISVSGFPVGTVYVDYYIGDSDPATNPAGMVRLKLRPVNLTLYQAAGVDQKIQNFVIP